MIIEMRISPAYQIFIEVYWKNLKNAAMGDYEGQSVASLVAKSQLPTPLKKKTPTNHRFGFHIMRSLHNTCA